MFDEGWGWLNRLVYKQILDNGFKIEYEVGDIKYCIKHKVDDFMKQLAIPVRNVGYCSLHCFHNIYYTTRVDKICGTGEHVCFNNNGCWILKLSIWLYVSYILWVLYNRTLYISV